MNLGYKPTAAKISRNFSKPVEASGSEGGSIVDSSTVQMFSQEHNLKAGCYVQALTLFGSLLFLF